MTNIYIDASNLHLSSKELGFEINYKKFIGWLRQKYKPTYIYLFIGFVPNNKNTYKKLSRLGYNLILKDAVIVGSKKIKGNCDTEIVLQMCLDFFDNSKKDFILISGDGDFKCVVDFLINKNSNVLVLAPNSHRCSILLKRTSIRITYLNNHYHKFST